ncbi:MAG: oligosaccharyl transferase, archaeosortase A system-associated [Gammaproteobacteria bacterium]|nr:oligosaccharyl transferase, archaeosortase A system-associated [Gammaproteobacteria bacterium]
MSNKNFNLIPEDNFRQALLLIIFAIAMFFIRTIIISPLVFTDWPGEHGNFVNFSADDAVYHMRLVHNTIHHFPWRVFFDPFTHFPYGNQIHFGPLFTLIIAAAALIAGLGNPSPELVNIVGAYTPVIMGILCLLPVYFIARKIAGKKAAIITAFIFTFLPGAFLQRSALGFTDHHVAEVLFSTTTIAFLIYAIDGIKSLKSTLVYGLFAGVTFGLFILIWPAALMFGAIFLIFFIARLIINLLKDNPTKHLLPLAIILYGIPAIMVLPFALMNPHFELMYYSLTQPVILIAMAAAFAICYITHTLCKKTQLTKDLYSIIIVIIFALIVIILHLCAPKLSIVIQDGCKLLFEPTPGMKTVSEVRPSIIGQNSDEFTIVLFWGTYFWSMLLVVIGFGHLCYRAYKNINTIEILLLIWSTTIILASIAQCRFNYYLATNVAILAGCYCITPFFDFMSSLVFKRKFYLKLQKAIIYTLFCFFVLLIIDPILMFLIDKTMPGGLQISREWYNTYMWLKKHTPDPQGKIIDKDFNYAAGHYPIPQNPNATYQYPKSAYSIMAWWEIGHQLTYIAERIPNSNPFQVGIIEKDNNTGAALFFTSSDEKKAVKNLNDVGSRYVLIDSKTANRIEGIGIWTNDTKGWTKSMKTQLALPPKKLNLEVLVDSEKFLQSMLYRLYYKDTNGLEHFRLIYESDGDYLVILRRALFKPKFHADFMQISFNKYDTSLKNARIINEIVWADKEKTILAYQARPPAKNIKVFEKVKGATISGAVSKNIANQTKITLTLKLKTKYNRIFTYKQTGIVTKGRYKFVVPYPTTPMTGDNYSYDIKPIGDYQIKAEAQIIKISVTEEDVMQGKNININIF